MAIKKSELYSSLWSSCDELRGGMDASQYKDYVLVLLFIKYVSDKYAGVPYAPITISPVKVEDVDDLVPHARITDFKISVARTARGVGFEGRVPVELEKGLSEETIRLFNLLVDYASYCGTGMW